MFNFPYICVLRLSCSIHQQHCLLKVSKHGQVCIRPCEKDCRVLVNGGAIAGETELEHNDRLVIGSTQLWVFQNPLVREV